MKNEIIRDYYRSGLSVKQIAKKHGVCMRTVYNAVKGKTNRRGQHPKDRLPLYLSKEDAETLLLCFLEVDGLIPGYKTKSIEDRVLSIADELTTTK